MDKTTAPKRNHMDDFFKVGPKKPIGFLPIYTVELCGWTPEGVAAWASSAGLSTATFAEGECHTESGAVYVWDASAVQRVLDVNRAITSTSNWPQDADPFVHTVATRLAEGQAIFDLVGVMFSDSRMVDSLHVRRA